MCLSGTGVFEKRKARPGDKRKKARNQDPTDIDGFLGPWAKFKDEKTVMCPTEVCANSHLLKWRNFVEMEEFCLIGGLFQEEMKELDAMRAKRHKRTKRVEEPPVEEKSNLHSTY